MHATIENLITCSHPKECCQPGTEDFAMPDGTILEFCEYHAKKLIDWELAQWQETWENRQRELADMEAQYDNLTNEDAEIERTEAHDELDALLEEEESGDTMTHKDIFKNLDFDDDEF